MDSNHVYQDLLPEWDLEDAWSENRHQKGISALKKKPLLSLNSIAADCFVLRRKKLEPTLSV